MQRQISLTDFGEFENANHSDGTNKLDVLHSTANRNVVGDNGCNDRNRGGHGGWRHLAQFGALSFGLFFGLYLSLEAQIPPPPPTPTATPWVLLPTPTPTPANVIPTVDDAFCDEIAVSTTGFAFCEARQYPTIVTASHPISGWENMTGFVEIWWQTLGNVLVITTPNSLEFVSPSLGIHVLDPPTNHQKLLLENGEVWVALLNCPSTCMCPVLYEDWQACQYGSECSVSYSCEIPFTLSNEKYRWWCKDGWTTSYDHPQAWVEANKMYHIICQGNFGQRGGEIHVTLYPSQPSTITMASVWVQTTGQVWVRAGTLAKVSDCAQEIKVDNQAQNTTVSANVVVSQAQSVHALGSVGDYWKNANGYSQIAIDFMVTCEPVSPSISANPVFSYRVITFEPAPIPTITPFTMPTTTAIYTFDFSYVTSTCYVILEQFDAQLDVPIINRQVGFTIPHLEICFDYYNLNLHFMGIDISYYAAAIIAATLLFSIVSRLWGGE
ncbi:MAG: hypothetical protein QXY41_07540 [Thermoproteota archaeon]